MARTYGRVYATDGTYQWIVVETDANGLNSYVWLTTLIQTLKLVLRESPFYSQYGIPSIQSVLTQIYPDYYVQIVQQQFAQYFTALTIVRSRNGTPNDDGSVSPTYNVQAVLLDGTVINQTVAT